MALDIDTVFRDHVIKGDIHSGANDPDKAEIRSLLKTLTGSSSAPAVVKQTKAALDLVAPASETYGGLVLNDPDPTKNGYYYRSSSTWVKGRGFPDTFAQITLGGTANAQTGTVAAGVSPADVLVYFATVSTTNAGPMTLSISGEAARDVVNAAGNALSAGEWTGTVIFFLNGDGDYQLLFDAGAVASAAQSATDAETAQAAAELARDQAQAAASSVSPTEFPTIAAAEALTPVSAPAFIRTAGYAAAGDGGGALYKKVASEPTHTGKFSITLDDGVTVVWYEIAETRPNLAMFGGVAQDAVEYCMDAGATLVIPQGTWGGDVTLTLTGPLRIEGTGYPVITGKWTFSADFPPSADPVDVTADAPFLQISGLQFDPVDTASYALTVIETLDTYSFIDTMTLRDCRFFGRLGLNTKSLATFILEGNWFYCSSVGWLAESCTNGTIDGNFWRGAAQAGVIVTKDETNANRTGGENLRFTQCEWDVCATGIVMDRHMWGRFESCLFDYCRLPMRLDGSIHIKLSKCYLGAANIGSISSHPDYVAPFSEHIALVARGILVGANRYSSSVSADQCEFLCYNSGATQPLVYCEGFISGFTDRHIDRVSFNQCKFIYSQNHVAERMAGFSYCTSVGLIDNQWVSYNKSTTLTEVYRISDSLTHTAFANDTQLVEQSGVTLKPAGEQGRLSKIIMTDTSLQIVNQSGEVVAEFLSGGNDRTKLWISGGLKSLGASTPSGGFSNVIIPG